MANEALTPVPVNRSWNTMALCREAKRGFLLRRFVICLGIMCSGSACVLTDPQELTWQREIAQGKRESEWWFESRQRLAPFLVPLTLTFNHDRFVRTSLVTGDRLLLIGTQSWEFYQPDNDYLYLIDLPSGKLLIEKALNYRVAELFCGPGEYAAFEGSRFDKVSRISTTRLVFLRLPSAEVVGEIDFGDLGLTDHFLGTIYTGGSLAAISQDKGKAVYFSLPVSVCDGHAEPGRILSPDEVERLKDDQWPREVLTRVETSVADQTINGITLRLSPICVVATRENPPATTHTRPSESAQGVMGPALPYRVSHK